VSERELSAHEQEVADAFFALLFNTHTQKLSVAELMDKYNTSFRKGLVQLKKEELLEVVSKSKVFRVRKNLGAYFFTGGLVQ